MLRAIAAMGPITAPAIHALFGDGMGLEVIVEEEVGDTVEILVGVGVLDDEAAAGEAVRVH